MTPRDRRTLDYATPQSKRPEARATAELRLIGYAIVVLIGAAIAALSPFVGNSDIVLKAGAGLIGAGWLIFIVEWLRGAGRRDE